MFLLSLLAFVSAALRSIRKPLRSAHFLAKDLGTLTTNVSLIATSHYFALRSFTVADVWEAAVRRHPHRVFVAFEEQSWTYHDADHLANRLARWLRVRARNEF